MSRLSADQRGMIESQLNGAGASLPCPRCGHERHSLLDGYVLENLQSQLRNLVFSSDNRVACVATVCDRCGYLSQHVIDVLGGGSPTRV